GVGAGGERQQAQAETPGPAAPAAPVLPAFSLSADAAEAEGTYVVAFSGSGVPAGFAAAVAKLGGTVVFAHGEAGIGAVRGLSAESAGALARVAGVSQVAGDVVTDLAPLADGEAPEGAAIESPTAPQTASFYPRQWNLRAIRAHDAWAAGRLGSPSVRVGIIDTGLGYTHADLAGRVDLGLSVSFVPADDALIATSFPGAHPVADLHYHGTHVGATVASNAVVAAGVTSRVTLVGIKACGASGGCATSRTLQGLLYAADQGLDVVNISIGALVARRDMSASGGDGPALGATIGKVINYAHRKGVTVVVSAGNNNHDLDHDGDIYKFYCTAANVICVSATGPTAAPTNNGPFTDVDARAPYSNYGRSAVDVAAPGGAGGGLNRGFVSAACSTFSLSLPVCQAGGFVVGLNGTSMASPHAAGVAALIVEDVGRDPAQVRARLLQTADDLGQPGVDPIYGKGRINAARAVGLE
ncbi:MAG TPA: S8 family serine peptidase, partial [Longimicrobium sp.]|nr:S8 family serine peptidase [Longimicrobium sp.]